MERAFRRQPTGANGNDNPNLEKLMPGLNLSSLGVSSLTQRAPGTVSPVTPTPTPTPPYSPPTATSAMLPTLTTSGASYAMVTSTERLLSGYSGPLGARNSGESSGGYTDLGIGNAGILSSEVPSPDWLLALPDQATGTFALYEDTRALRPRIRPDVPIGPNSACLSILFSGNAGGPFPQIGVLNDSFAIAERDRTEISVFKPSWAGKNNFFSSHVAGSTMVRNTYTNITSGFKSDGRIAAGFDLTSVRLPCNWQVLVIRETPSGVSLFVNGVKTDLPTATSAVTLTRVMLGQYSDGVSAVPCGANMRIAAYIQTNKGVSDADAAAITLALNGRFGIDPNHTLNLVHVGDSIGAGSAATDTLDLQHYMLPAINAATRYHNFCVDGSTLAEAYAARSIYEGSVFASGKTNILLIDGGINDLAGGTTGANLYANTATPYIAAAKALGYKVGLVTILPDKNASYPVSASEIAAFNTSARANTAGADFIVDRAANATMGAVNAPDDTTLYQDKIHPTSLGYSYLGPVYVAALNAAL